VRQHARFDPLQHPRICYPYSTHNTNTYERRVGGLRHAHFEAPPPPSALPSACTPSSCIHARSATRALAVRPPAHVSIGSRTSAAGHLCRIPCSNSACPSTPSSRTHVHWATAAPGKSAASPHPQAPTSPTAGIHTPGAGASSCSAARGSQRGEAPHCFRPGVGIHWCRAACMHSRAEGDGDRWNPVVTSLSRS
jgi:hypothetical protein